MIYSKKIIHKVFFGLICMIIFQGVEGSFSSVKAMNLREEGATNQLGSDEVLQLNSNKSSSCHLWDPHGCSTDGQL
jgi:hypothetical protein